MTANPAWEDPDKLDELFTQITSDYGTRVCLCPQRTCKHHFGQTKCPNPASVVYKLHVPIICQLAHARRPDIVDENGDGRQVACTECLKSAFVDVRVRLARMKLFIQAHPEHFHFPDGIPHCTCGRRLQEVSDVLTIIERFEPVANTDPDTERGLYRKYRVQKVIHGTDQRGDPSEDYIDYPGEYFVLAAHDPHARAALRAYADSCAAEFPKLASDLRDMSVRWDSR